MSKTVTVFNTRGSNITKIPDVTAGVWEELQDILDENGISHRGMTAIESETQMSFSTLQSKLPDRDFILFLYPVKANSGSEAVSEDGGTGPEDRQTGEAGFEPMTLERLQGSIQGNYDFLRSFVRNNSRSLGTAFTLPLEQVAEKILQSQQDASRLEQYLRNPETYGYRVKAEKMAAEFI